MDQPNLKRGRRIQKEQQEAVLSGDMPLVGATTDERGLVRGATQDRALYDVALAEQQAQTDERRAIADLARWNAENPNIEPPPSLLDQARAQTEEARRAQILQSMELAGERGTGVLGAAGEDATYIAGVGAVSTTPGMRGMVLEPEEGSGYRPGDKVGAPGGAVAARGFRTEMVDGVPTQVPVQGGPEWEKMQRAANTAQQAAGTVVKDADEALKVLRASGQRAAGFGGWLASIPSTSAKELSGHLESVRSNIGFDQLMAIKQSGAGLGHVPQAQLLTLQSVLGNLDQIQSPEVLNRNLSRIRSIYWWIAAPGDFLESATQNDYYNAGLSPDIAQNLLQAQEKKGLLVGRGLSFGPDAYKPGTTPPRRRRDRSPSRTSTTPAVGSSGQPQLPPVGSLHQRGGKTFEFDGTNFIEVQ
jgi:hypothetical protein